MGLSRKLARKSIQNWSNLRSRLDASITATNFKPFKVGEIIKVSSKIVAGLTYVAKIASIYGKHIVLSTGEISTVFQFEYFYILERNLPEPKNWLEHELELTRYYANVHDCEDCRENYQKKLKQFEQYQAEQSNMAICH